jgi:hypothetical protein
MAFATFMVGLLITMFGVGGVENSIKDSELLLAIGVSLAGLMLMCASVPYLSNQEEV